MRRIPLIVLMSLAMAGGAFAQGSSTGVTMSTDPAKAAAVERHAQELKAQEAQAKPAAKASSAKQGKPQSKQKASTAKSHPKQKSSTAKPVAKK